MRKNKLAVFDIDGTIFRKNLHFELIDELAWLKIFSRDVRDQLVNSYIHWIEHRGTYETYRKELVELYAQHIRGCYQKDIIKASKIVVPFYARRTYVFAENLIKKLKNENYCIIAVSGSPVEIVEEYNRSYLKFDAAFGSVYEIDKHGVYTGKTLFEPTKHKGSLVKQYAYENKLSFKNSYGIGDTESDASFLEIVENPLAFNPNQNLKKIAEKRGWKIIVEKKDVIYIL